MEWRSCNIVTGPVLKVYLLAAVDLMLISDVTDLDGDKFIVKKCHDKWKTPIV